MINKKGHTRSLSKGLAPSRARGFTLIEMLIVMGILAILAAMTLFMEINNYRGDAFRSEANSLGISLQTARADALNNINQKRHGVAIHPGGYDGYIIFEGDSYDPADPISKSIEASYGVTFAPTSPDEITFEQLTGNANYNGDITLIDPERNMTAVISINYEGKISW